MLAFDVELKAATKRYGAVTAVDAVDLGIEAGEFLSLLGPSGCGKTTTLRMIAGFEQPTSGQVLIGDVDVAGVPPYRRNVNTVFQSYALFPHMSVVDNVAYGLRQRGVSRSERTSKAHEALALVQLSGLEQRKPRELSGGQQQRVALARALVMRPRVLLLDEPLGALDLKLRKQMQIELKSLQAELGVTFVYVTHDQEEAMSMSDRIAVMNAGRIEQLGPPIEVYDRPATPFVADFIGDMNLLDGTVAEVSHDRCDVMSDGLHVIARPAELARGDTVRVGLRPERIGVVAEAAEGTPNVARGTVTATMVLGDTMRVVADIGGGRHLVARIPRGADAPTEWLTSGAAATLTWSEDAVLLLDDSRRDGAAQEVPR